MFSIPITVTSTNPVDGPWMMYPFASVYRAIVAVNSNDFIKTIFTAEPCEKVLTDGEMWAFDFNREVHRIEQIKKSTNKRYTLKLHYLVYPSSIPFYGHILGFLTSVYDTIARLAFLKTLTPKSGIEKLLWGFIMFMTHLFYGAIRMAGNSGAIAFLVLSGVTLYWTKTDVPLFMIASSFVHYFIYIATYYFYQTHRERIVFTAFKSTVMFYKGVAFYHLIFHYIKHIDWSAIDWMSIGMITIGFWLSGMAAGTIGIDQTYFGAELGRMEPNRIHSFPYNLTHHPMIIGNLIGLAGFYKLDGFRTALPWLVPVHVFLYVVHMLQEHFDIHKVSNIKQGPATITKLKKEE
jgi:hypothetical protein